MWSVKYLPKGIFSRLISFNLLRSTFVILISAAAIIIINFTQRNEKKNSLKLGFMSLDNIQLPAIVIHDLFKDSLIALNTEQAVSVSPTTATFTYLGNNQKSVVVIVNDEDAIY